MLELLGIDWADTGKFLSNDQSLHISGIQYEGNLFLNDLENQNEKVVWGNKDKKEFLSPQPTATGSFKVF